MPTEATPPATFTSAGLTDEETQEIIEIKEGG
jgi:hypothetical protein